MKKKLLLKELMVNRLEMRGLELRKTKSQLKRMKL